MKIKVGDKVQVIAGKDKGTIANVLKVIKEKDQIIVEGTKKATKFFKKRGDQPGSMVEITMPMHVSNVMLYEESEKKAVRTTRKNVDGKWVRTSKVSGNAI